MKPIQFIFLLLGMLLISKIYTHSQSTKLKCDEEEIDHCKKCGSGEFSDTCIQCEDNYFPFLFNYLCFMPSM